MDGVTVANENNSFVQTTGSLKSAGAGSYTCQVSLTAVSVDIVRVLNQEILSGKSTFLIVDLLILPNMEVFFLYFVLSSFCIMETLTLSGLRHLSLVLYSI